MDGMRKPLCIDLFCGLGGWAEGFLAEGWDVIGFDIERHVYGDQRYPAQLVLQDVLTLHGSQFRNADCIIASPPCQEYSYMAMPWSRAKQIAAAIRGEPQSCFPYGYFGSCTIPQLTALFDTCFRVQREACEAAGRHIPMVVENVNGAQPWVGKARANFGSFYFWGDVAMVGGRVVAGIPQFGQTVKAARRGGIKVGGFSFHQFEKTGQPGTRFTWRDCGDERKQPLWFNDDKHRKCGGDWFGPGEDCSLMRQSSKSSARKAASAQIAKIPFPLASYIARSFKPSALPAQAG